MGKVIPFSEFQLYLANQKNGPEFFAGAILDTNILVTMGYEVKKDHEYIRELLDFVAEEGIRFLATVTTKGEFIEFNRRLILTEGLIDLVDIHSKAKIPKSARASIHTATGIMRTNVKRGADPVFTDGQLKAIKHSFSAGQHSGHVGWLTLCKEILLDRIRAIEQELRDRGVIYISPHEQISFFNKPLEWENAIQIVAHTGISFSDAMILNALESTKCSFMLSLDFDIGYAVLSGSVQKDVLMPDELVKAYRNYHFPN